MKAEYSISKEIIPGDWRRMNLSLDAREGETEKEFMDRVAGTVDSWFEQRFGIHPPPNSTQSPLPEIKVEREEPVGMEAAIGGATSVKTLDSLHKLMTMKYPHLEFLFNEKREKLIQEGNL